MECSGESRAVNGLAGASSASFGNFGAASTATPSFGAAASTPTFGIPAASSGGSGFNLSTGAAFGASPAPFGQSTPATAGSLFGSTTPLGQTPSSQPSFNFSTAQSQPAAGASPFAPASQPAASSAAGFGGFNFGTPASSSPSVAQQPAASSAAAPGSLGFGLAASSSAASTPSASPAFSFGSTPAAPNSAPSFGNLLGGSTLSTPSTGARIHATIQCTATAQAYEITTVLLIHCDVPVLCSVSLILLQTGSVCEPHALHFILKHLLSHPSMISMLTVGFNFSNPPASPAGAPTLSAPSFAFPAAAQSSAGKPRVGYL